MAGVQRYRTQLARVSGATLFDADRMRSTWICGLLSGGVPIDVIAAAAAVTPEAVSQYLLHVPPPSFDEITGWLSTRGRATPPSRPALPVVQVPAPSTARDCCHGPTANEVLGAFVPRKQAARHAWSSDIGAQFRELILRTTDDPGRAKDFAAVASVFLEWAAHKPGLPLTITALLKESTIERFAAQRGIGDSLASYRAFLRALALTASGREVPIKRPPVVTDAPYTDAELAALTSPDIAISDQDRRIRDVYLACSLGAGATGAEVKRATRRDVLVLRDTVFVRIGDRLVPLAPPLRGLLEGLATTSGDGPLTGLKAGHTTRALRRVSGATGVELSALRFRATWLARHLDRGVPFHVLAAAAGAKISRINHLLKGIGPRDPSDIAGWLLRTATVMPTS